MLVLDAATVTTTAPATTTRTHTRTVLMAIYQEKNGFAGSP